MIFNCETCGVGFKGRSGKSNRFCSLPCYHKSLKGKVAHNRGVWHKKECMNCGKTFEHRESEVQKYCSHDCYHKHTRSPDIGKLDSCVNCGNEYTRSIKGQTTCSKECSVENLLKHNDAVFLKKRKCKGCGESFQPRNRYRTYCSKKCYDGIRHEESIKHCENCNETFKRKSLKQRFCSDSCAKKYMVGENNGTYKGYVTTNEGYLRYSTNHKEYPDEYVHRVKWFKNNDTRICNRCDKPVEHIHHIDRDKQNNELDNLEGLCARCHAIEHVEDKQFWMFRKALL